jgi:lipoyl-dependent peroxiredoxin
MGRRAFETRAAPFTPSHPFSHGCVMRQFAEVLHTAATRTTGGRERGISRSPDGVFDIRFAAPESARIGTTPEHLLAAAWSASFESALTQAVRARGLALRTDFVVEAEVDLCVEDGGAPFLRARLDVCLPGVARDIARAIVDEAQLLCPYSRATRENIDVAIRMVR